MLLHEQRSRVRAVGIAIVAGAAIAVTGCGSDDGGGASGGGSTDGEIVIGATGPLTGPASSLAILYDAMRAKIAEVNAQGGIEGHKVRLAVQDDQLNPANTPGVVRKLVEGEKVSLLCGSAGSPTNVAVLPYLGARKVALVPGAGGSDLAAENSYIPLPTYEPLAASLVDYGLGDGKAERIAIAYSEDAVGKPTRAGANWALQQKNEKAVAEVKYNPTAADQSAAAAKLKASGADFVVVNNTAPVLAPLIKAAAKIGYRPTWGIMWPALTDTLVELVGEDAAERIVFASPFLLGSDPKAAGFREALTKQKPGADTNDTIAMLGWVAATTCTELVKKAVQANGGKTPSTEQVIQAMPGFSYGDDYVPDIKWTEEDHSTKGNGAIIGVRDGKFTPLTESAPLPDAPIAEPGN
ncbi:MAG: ABC transporter substrate-binding protein [Solirubrobacteraceae bacterium]